jgi:hypothetical protein
MALLGHSIVEAGLTRLGAIWPKPTRPAQLRLIVGKKSPPDTAALATANAIYSGQHTLSADDFASLDWLQQFAKSGRQLLMCHALKLMEGWNTLKPSHLRVDDQADLVLRLVRSATRFSAALDCSVLEPLHIALIDHLKRLQTLRTNDPCEQLTKAMTLLEASQAIEGGAGLEKEAARLLDQALPSHIADDGGPILHDLSDYVGWVSLLLDAEANILNPLSRNAVDRARPFLSMLLDQSETYCFAPHLKTHANIVATTPMRLAPATGVARLQTGKTVVISMPQQLTGEATLHVSSHGHWLFSAHHFQHDDSEASAQTYLTSSNTEDGHLLQQSMGATDRTVFLSPKGDDLRIEDVVPNDNLKRWMRLQFNPDTKISVARNGSVATIARDGRNSWSLSLRGARILPIQHKDQVTIETTTNNGRINWALKRITRSINRADKAEIPELPF